MIALHYDFPNHLLVKLTTFPPIPKSNTMHLLFLLYTSKQAIVYLRVALCQFAIWRGRQVGTANATKATIIKRQISTLQLSRPQLSNTAHLKLFALNYNDMHKINASQTLLYQIVPWKLTVKNKNTRVGLRVNKRRLQGGRQRHRIY